MCSSWLLLNANCCYKMEHPLANLPPPESSPALLMHCYLVNSDSKVQTLPHHIAHQSCFHFPVTAYCFGADKLFKANIWDQIHPWCNSTEVTGVLHPRDMRSLLHKGRILSIFLSFTSMNLKSAPLLMTYLY